MVFATTALARDKLPETTPEGLVLQHDTKLAAVYMRPGASLAEYDKIALLKAYVAFRKNWVKEHNRNEGFEQQLRDRDVKHIRSELAEEFTKVFTEVLSTRGGHEMVAEGGDGVLIIRPALINLEVTAPDLMTPGRQDNYAASAGQMTLYMELLDGVSGELLYRVIDPEAAGNDVWRIRNEVTNRADADRVLRRWATLLNDHLARVKGEAPAN
jgi:hypothetical protein